MSTTRKVKNISKRHFRRIISTQTNIDIAGWSEQSSNKTCFTCDDSSDTDISENINETTPIFYINETIVDSDNKVIFSDSESMQGYDQCEISVQGNNDQNSVNVVTNDNIQHNDKEV